MSMVYVYILKSEAADQIYTGLTSDIKRRFGEHNNGHTSHTNKYKPWKLIAYIGFESERTARAFESYLKTGSGIAFSRKHFLRLNAQRILLPAP